MCALSVLAMYYRRTRYLAAVFVAAFAMSARAVASRGNLALCAAIRARSVTLHEHSALAHFCWSACAIRSPWREFGGALDPVR